MKSILENRPALAAEVNKVAEVAGYLWQKGWACLLYTSPSPRD